MLYPIQSNIVGLTLKPLPNTKVLPIFSAVARLIKFQHIFSYQR